MQRESANGDSSHCVNNPRPLRNSLEIRATRSVRGSTSLAGTGDSVTTNFRSADHGSGPGTHRVGQRDSHDVVPCEGRGSSSVLGHTDEADENEIR